MDIAWFRDLVICISGLVTTAVVIFVTVLAYSLYRRTKSVLDSLQATSTSIRRISSEVENEVVTPLMQIASLAQGLSQGIDMVNRLFKKRSKKGG